MKKFVISTIALISCITMGFAESQNDTLSAGCGCGGKLEKSQTANKDVSVKDQKAPCACGSNCNCYSKREKTVSNSDNSASDGECGSSSVK